MFDERYRKRLNQQQNAGLYRAPALVDEKTGTTITVNGEKLLNFASNDYLGLANDPRVKACISRHFERMGCSSSSSRLVTGNHSVIREAELKFADYFGYEDALFFPSGFQANLSILSTLF
jgi:8-amino-7-oxononanoate synthase